MTAFKATGHLNAYFPLFIPLSFLEKEAAHVEGFAKECAVVTHHRWKKKMVNSSLPANWKSLLLYVPHPKPSLATRLPSWVESYRDLPLLVNQWANVVRWELRPRIFLRTTEFCGKKAILYMHR